MARIARVVVPFYPHHVTQRGSRRQRTFFRESDYAMYLALMSKACREAGTEVWAYCLMPNHVHLVMVPSRTDGLRVPLAQVHRRYASTVNARYDWRGHLWQERFHSCPMDEPHLLAAARYVERNPVAASLCRRPGDWRWSSAAAHLRGRDDDLVTVQPLLSRVGDWSDYVLEEGSGDLVERIGRHSRSGRPAGDEDFVAQVERETGRSLSRGRPGRPRKRGN